MLLVHVSVTHVQLTAYCPNIANAICVLDYTAIIAQLNVMMLKDMMLLLCVVSHISCANTSNCQSGVKPVICPCEHIQFNYLLKLIVYWIYVVNVIHITITTMLK